VPDLLAGKVAAATAFWNDEGVTLNHDHPGFHVFRVERYGAPPYPELVLSTTEAELQRQPGLAAGVVSALVGGYRFTLAHPAQAAGDLETLVPGLDPTLVSDQLRALLPAFRAADGRVGTLDPALLERWAEWETRFGIVRQRPDVGAMFDPSLADRANSAG
jgi:putative hydroxymethylpyrimidine transport system substrate-binding protein